METYTERRHSERRNAQADDQPHGIRRREFLVRSCTAIAGLALWGCPNTDPLGGDAGDPRLQARPFEPTQALVLGASALNLGSGRDGVLYVPQSAEAGAHMPLLIALHGAGGAGQNWSGFYEAAEEYGVIILAPDSRGGTWDRTRGAFGPDVAFIDEALLHTFDRCPVDPTRIALGGFSDGASYGLSLGVSNGDLFTNLIAFSPGFFAPGEPIVGKPRVFVSHGTADPILPVTASRNVIVPELLGDGYDVTYAEFDGTHEVTDEIGNAALDWFLA